MEDDAMGLKFPNETREYRQARKRLLDKEIALRRQMESVARMRRDLPQGGAVPEDYVFDGLALDGKPSKIKLSDLFRAGTDTLLIYNYMFPRHKGDTRDGAKQGETARLPKAEQPCPSCTGLLDQLNGAAPHFEAGGDNFVVVANAPLDRLLAVARDRSWQHLRMLSSAGNSFKRDYHAQDEDGQQEPVILVFKRDADGTVRLFWASEMVYAKSDPGQDNRAAGTIEPFWNMFDLGSHGRPDFEEQLQYDCVHGARPMAFQDAAGRDGKMNKSVAP
jgi:predicted dithiol-disulfide oxidoreductase (DUF899 family)